MGDDFLLLCRMHQGDESAIEEFVRKYYPLILRYCRLHLWDSAEAEDLTQEVFARFFRTLPQYRHSGKLANYLYVIAGNLCRDSYKKPRPLPLEDAPEQSRELTPDLDRKMDVRRALDSLPPELREAAVLYFYQELPQRSIAKILGIGLPLVKYRIRRAKELLAVLLLPELWKNRSCDAVEVECTTLYSLRAIYAARLTLFAGVDLVLLSLFFAAASVLTRVTVGEMLIQFLLPYNITCTICLATLYSRRIRNQSMSMLLCLCWAAVWLLLILNDGIYAAISAPLWALALAGSFGCLGCTVLRGQRKGQLTWEATPIWN